MNYQHLRDLIESAETRAQDIIDAPPHAVTEYEAKLAFALQSLAEVCAVLVNEAEKAKYQRDNVFDEIGAYHG